MRHDYRTHRDMRALRRVAFQRGVIAILDIGTSKIVCFVLRVGLPEPGAGEGWAARHAGRNRLRVIGTSVTRSRGIRFGEIETIAETERAIRTAIQAAQKTARVRVDHVIATITGGEPRSYGLSGEIDVGGNAVNDQDVSRVLASCALPDIGAGRSILHAQPVNFTLDNRAGIEDPRGRSGHSLSCDIHLLTIDVATRNNLAKCVKGCDLSLAGIFSSAYASGIACLLDDERELGSACIDMGGGATGLSMFWKKHLIHADCSRLGGDHVTSDISICLGVSPATAEWLKTRHGAVVATSIDDRETIEIGMDRENERRSVNRAELIGIMRPRVEEILEDIRARLDAAGFQALPSQQIILTGGGSLLPGLDHLAQRILGQQVRTGRPYRIDGLPDRTAGAAFASPVGLCLIANDPQDEVWDFDIPPCQYPKRSWKRTLRWFRENW